MTQLTEERFEQILTEKLAPLATKEDVHREVREGVEELARITSAGFAHTQERFDDIESRIDVAAQLKTFERKFQKLEEELHIKL